MNVPLELQFLKEPVDVNPVPSAEDLGVPMLCETWQNHEVCISASAGGSLASQNT